MQQHKQISVAIAGARGRMGSEALHALELDKRFVVSGLLVRSAGQFEHNDVPVFDDVQSLIDTVQPDIWLDLTDTTSVVSNVDVVLSNRIRPVVGATGYTQDDIHRWADLCRREQLGCVIAPNFAIGALLMIRFAEQAARFLPNVEIIELHHDGKRDAPSGTAKRTAEAISKSRRAINPPESASQEETSRARGLVCEGVPVHSVRLPGLVAHQEVLFGGSGETLTIRHDSMSRQSFMPGVLMACEQVTSMNTLVYGLEHLMF